KTELSFTTMLADEYPRIAEQAPLSQLRYSGPTFKKIVESTAFCAATSDSRPVLTGVNFTMEGKQQHFVCTDSHRLGKINVVTSDCLEEDTTVKSTIPAHALIHAVKTFDLTLDVFLVSFKGMVAFANGNVIYYSRLIEGNYPDTDRLIPIENSTEIVVNKHELHDVVTLLREASQDSIVKLTITNEVFQIAAKNELAKGSAEIAIGEKIGEDLTIAFSSKYLLEAINSFTSDTLQLSFSGAMRPFIIRSTDENDTSLQMILPVRTY
ncbi:DNA polymerase III subunit beta, partial [Butyricicoccus sp. 1XD8-22]